MALRGEIIDFCGLHFAHNLQDAHGIAEIGIMQMEVGMTLQMSDALTEINRRTADCSMYIITLFKQEFREKRTVLAGYTGD